MRHLALNLLTASATVLLLAALTWPAVQVFNRADEARAQPEPVGRWLGVAVDPWHVDEWSNAVGAKPQLIAKFEAFSRRRSIKPQLTEAQRRGVKRLMISWEPWRPVPASRGQEAQSRPQRGYRNRDIAQGAQDQYISRFAHLLAGFDGVVYLRYAHEMNGTWYPWAHNARAYVRGWRRIVRIFARADARNVRFVWSVNPNLYEPEGPWLARLRAYWPGRRFVDALGTTMINFGGIKDYTVDRFAPRLEALHRAYRLPVIITEANTAYDGRVAWLDALRGALRRMPWVRGLVWSQLPSRGKAQLEGVGRVDWDVRRDPPAAAKLREIMHDGLARPGD